MHFFHYLSPSRGFPVRFFAFFFLLIVVSAKSATAEELAVMKILVNEDVKGDFFVYLQENGDVQVSFEDLSDFGFIKFPARAKSGDRASLRDAARHLSYKIIHEETAIYITAAPLLLKTTVNDFSKEREIETEWINRNAAFINYSIGLDQEADGGKPEINIPLEAGFNLWKTLLESDFSYSKDETDENFVRLQTTIKRDAPSKLRRIEFGDFIGPRLPFGGANLLGGVKLSKNYSMAPELDTSPGVNISGIAETPSEAEIYVDGVLIKRQSLPPGRFEFRDLPVGTGAGNAAVIIKDAQGREKSLEKAFYISPIILKPGIHDYEYGIGFRRKNYGVDDWDYDSWAGQFFHKTGLTDSLTMGIHGQAGPDAQSFGPSAAFLLGRKGEGDAAAAVSSSKDGTGWAGRLALRFVRDKINFRAASRFTSKNYNDLSINGADLGWTWSTGAGYSHPYLGSISLNLSGTNLRANSSARRTDLSYSRSLGGRASFFLNVSERREEKTSREAFFGVSIFMGKEHNANASSSLQENSRSYFAQLQKNAPRAEGFGYRLAANSNEIEDKSPELGADVSAQYNGRRGVYSLGYRSSRNRDVLNLDLGGGLAVMDGSLFMTRPMRDGFALVKTGALGGVDVTLNGEPIGATDKNGNLFVPELFSYSANDMSIDAASIPVDYEIDKTEKQVTTYHRGGGVVAFKLKRLQPVIGKLFIIEEGERKPAEYWGLALVADDKSIEAVIGKGGEFYIEELYPGSFNARAFFGEKECLLDLKIYDTDEMFIDLGEIECETIH